MNESMKKDHNPIAIPKSVTVQSQCDTTQSPVRVTQAQTGATQPQAASELAQHAEIQVHGEAARQLRVMSSGAAELIEPGLLMGKLMRSLQENRPLIIKLGLDPTAPDLHLGHAVVLRKMRQIQDMGHRIVIILGDFTGRIGDPTGRSKTRPQLTEADVLENAQTYKSQLFRILHEDRTEVRFNSEWLSPMNFESVLRLAATCTVAQMLEREDFRNRFDANLPISLHEFFYPLAQAMDSVALGADVEMGGTDQRFNILMGRDLQRSKGMEPQVALFMPLLEGTDGVEKMSKSLGNHIGISEAPEVMFGKVMSIPDGLIHRYFQLCTALSPDALHVVLQRLSSGENPRGIKAELAGEIVRLYHGEEAATMASSQFDAIFRDGGMPEEIPEYDMGGKPLEVDAARLLVSTGLAPSGSEARRLLRQGGIRLNGEKLASDLPVTVSPGDVLQAGKRAFVRLV